MNSDFEDFAKNAGKEDKSDEVIAQLEGRIEDLQVNLNETIFAFSLVIIILLNVIFFQSINNWGGPIAILFLELIFLIILGRRLDVKDVEMLTDKFIDGWCKKNSL